MTDINHQKRFEQLVALSISYRRDGLSDEEVKDTLMEPSISAFPEEAAEIVAAGKGTEHSDWDY